MKIHQSQNFNIHLKIQLRDGIKSLTTLKEGEFKVANDDCIKSMAFDHFTDTDNTVMPKSVLLL